MANNINWKMTAVIVGLLIAVGGWVWQAAITYSDVSDNSEDIGQALPKIETNTADIIGMKKDIAQVLKTQEKMIATEENNTRAIIEAIGRIRDGN